MTTPMTITLQIDPFCDCEGCIRKVKKALGKVGEVKLLAIYPDKGKFTILTIDHPEVIKYVLKRKFPKKNIILSQEINHAYPLHVDDVNDIAKALVTISQVKGLESVEYTQPNSFKLTFINPHNQPPLSSLPHTLPLPNGVHPEYASPPSPEPPMPQTNIRPSAPPIPTTPYVVYGFPQEFYDYNKNHPRSGAPFFG